MNHDTIHTLIRQSQRLLVLSRLATRGLVAAACLVVLALAVIVCDAMLGLPPGALVMLDGVLLSAAAFALVAMASAATSGGSQGVRGFLSFRPIGAVPIARLLEQRLLLRNSVLVNAIDLSRDHHTGSAQLAALAVQHGNDLAATIQPTRIIDWQELRLVTMRCGAVLLAVAVVSMLLPSGVFSAVVPRLLEPMGDHPPFTRLKFSVQIEPAPAYHGQSITLTANLTGPLLPDKAELVFINDDNTRQRVLMQRMNPPATIDSPPSEAVAYQFRIDRAEVSRTFYIDTPEGRSKRYTATVLPVPRFEKVGVTYHYPAYTGWEPVSGPVRAPGVRALRGTSVTLTVASNVALSGGTLRISRDDGAAEAIALVPDQADPKQASATFVADTDATLSMTLRAHDGTPSDNPYETQLFAIADEPPRITITEPGARLMVPEGWIVEVRVRAWDDIAIDRIELSHHLRGQVPAVQPLEIVAAARGPQQATATTRLDMAALGAKAGDVLTYHAIAYDRNPSGEGYGESAMHTIHVVSEDDYLDAERARYRIEDINKEFAAIRDRLDALEAQRDAILARLDALQDQLEPNQAMSDAQRNELDALDRQLTRYTRDTSRLIEELQGRVEKPELYAMEGAYTALLARLAAQLQAQVTAAEQVQSRGRPLHAEDDASAHKPFTEAAERFRETVEPFSKPDKEQRGQMAGDLASLGLAEGLLMAGQRLRDAIEQQQTIAEQLADFKDRPAPLTPAELEALARLGQRQTAHAAELVAATQQLRDAADTVAERLPNMAKGARELAAQIDASSALTDMRAAGERAAAGDSAAAHATAQHAADKLDALLHDIGDLPAQGAGDLDGSFSLPREQLGQALAQMAQSQGLPPRGEQQGQAGGDGSSDASQDMELQGQASDTRDGSSETPRSGGDGQGEGEARGTGAVEFLNPSELLEPGDTTAAGGAATTVFGVPMQYRDDARAYFRRLAEDHANVAPPAND